MTGIVAFKGSGNSVDRATDLTQAIKTLIYDEAEGLSMALVIGCIEIAKAEILEEAKE